MKKILGLDLGTNSIGWAVIVITDDNQISLESVGSRIIPMDAAILGDFAKGNSQSQTANRTKDRGTRKLYERSNQRRERLHRILIRLNLLPQHYSQQLDRYGKFLPGIEALLPWSKDAQGRPFFIFQKSFNEMLADFRTSQPNMVADGKKVPYDWTLYYLRKKGSVENQWG